ncbi:MAG: class I SAM-dependent methyltransferase [Pseudomonadota bacterium]
MPTTYFEPDPSLAADDPTIPVFAGWFGSWRICVHRRPMGSGELQSAYDRAAGRWARAVRRLGFEHAFRRLAARLLDEVQGREPGRALRVLDCGAGAGALSAALLRAASGPVRLDVVDLSPQMLERAQSALAGPNGSVSLHCADARRLPFSDGEFDLVMTAHMLEHMADPDVALREMMRVLKPGGVLAACVTRKTMLGFLVHLKWRTRRITVGEAKSWLAAAGAQSASAFPLGGGRLTRRLSLGCIGRKPALVAGPTHKNAHNTGD